MIGQARVTQKGEQLIEAIYRIENEFHSQHQRLFAKRTCLGKVPISLSHILEANAITTELLHVLVAHGKGCTLDYYTRVICHLPSVYSELLGAFIEISDDFQSSIVALQIAASTALYLAEDPTALFCSIAGEFAANRATFFSRFNPIFIAGWFAKTEPLVPAFARSPRLVDAKGDISQLARMMRQWFQDQCRFHDILYEARQLLFSKYIKDFEMDAKMYFDRTSDLPLPPIVFWLERLLLTAKVLPFTKIPLGASSVISKRTVTSLGAGQRVAGKLW